MALANLTTRGRFLTMRAMSPRQSRRGFLKACAALPLLGAASSFQVHLRAAEAKQPFATENEKINQARDVALSVLKPTPKQLEHGLRLHADSLSHLTIHQLAHLSYPAIARAAAFAARRRVLPHS